MLSRKILFLVFVLSLIALSYPTRTLWLHEVEKRDNFSLSAYFEFNFTTSQPLKLFVLPERFTLNDRISPTDFKREADFHFSSGLAKAEAYTALGDPSILKSSCVIFCDSPGLKMFAEEISPKINVSFVLLTGDSDVSMPGMFVEQARAVLSRPFLKHWYAMNCDLQLRPRFSCLPLGLSQWNQQRNVMQKAYEIGLGLVDGRSDHTDLLRAKSERPYWVFCGFQMYQGHKERLEAHEVFCGTNSSLRQISSCGFTNTYGVDVSAFNRLLDYYKKLAKTRFVVSPHGVGLDAYRTWESLYLGAYPIVQTSSLDELYENLPVLIVKEWKDVTFELLEVKFVEFRKRSSYSYERLYVKYWKERFWNHLRE